MAKDEAARGFDWRNDLRELAIVVIGVFIALIAQQAMEAWDWRQKVAAADDAMMSEVFYDDAPEMVQRASMQRCINGQLDGIRSAVEANAPRADVSGLIDRLYVPFVTYDSVAHANATASDVSTHMDHTRQGIWTGVYGMMPAIDAASAQESTDVAQLRALRRAGAAGLTAQEQDRVLGSVEAIRNDGVRMMAGINWAMSVMPQLHGRPDATRLNGFMKSARLHYGSCILDLPADWPATRLPRLPAGVVPGLPVANDGPSRVPASENAYTR